VGVEARFTGGPFDGQTHEIPSVMEWVSVAMEPVPLHLPDRSDLIAQTGLYQRDGLPNLSPYVYSWRGPR
jgi:hypothetical protein